MRFEVRGVVDGETRIVRRARHPPARRATPPTGPRARATGSSSRASRSVKLELELSSDHGDHNHAGCLATAMHVLNAIPHVVAADPGVLTYLDLPVYSARHLMTP